MAIEPPKIEAPPAATPDDQNRTLAGDRRVLRTADLSEEEIAAVEASEIEPARSSFSPGPPSSTSASTSPGSCADAD